MKHVLRELAWLTALASAGFVSIMIDVKVGFPAMLALIFGNMQ